MMRTVSDAYFNYPNNQFSLLYTARKPSQFFFMCTLENFDVFASLPRLRSEV